MRKTLGSLTTKRGIRTDLQPVRGADQISVDLRLPHRGPYGFDARPGPSHYPALECFPAVERAFDHSKSKAAYSLVTRLHFDRLH